MYYIKGRYCIIHNCKKNNHSISYNISQDILAILLLWIILSSPLFVSSSCLCGFLNLSLWISQIFFVYFTNCICGFLGLYCQGRHAWPCGPSVLHTCLGFLSRSLKENIFEHKFLCKLCFSSIVNIVLTGHTPYLMFGNYLECAQWHMLTAE